MDENNLNNSATPSQSSNSQDLNAGTNQVIEAKPISKCKIQAQAIFQVQIPM